MTDVIAIQPQLWILPLAVGVLALICIGCVIVVNKTSYFDETPFEVGALLSGILGGVLLVVWLVLLIPYDSKYHVYYKLSGTVESVTNTLQDGGDGERTMSPVVRISGFDQPIKMDDSRIVTLKGKGVDLKCSYAWNYEGLDEVNCAIRAIK